MSGSYPPGARGDLAALGECGPVADHGPGRAAWWAWPSAGRADDLAAVANLAPLDARGPSTT
jgi:hypothetical protein